jgi:DNA-binding NtrC family response regulator
VRQLKNIAEQISIIEEKRMVSPEVLQKYLQDQNTSDLPVLYKQFGGNDSLSERDLLYKVLFDMKKDMTEMKRLVAEIIAATGIEPDDDVVYPRRSNDRNDFEKDTSLLKSSEYEKDIIHVDNNDHYQKEEIPIDYHEEIEETLSLEKKEKEMIIRALEKHGGRRKNAAAELGISERTLYRKIKEYEISQ